MTTSRFREEVLNVQLAILLHERGIVAAPEQLIEGTLENQRQVPDVMVDYQGLITAIEGKIGDSSTVAEEAISKARHRVESGVAHLGVAVLYPSELRSTTFDELHDRLGESSLRLAVISEAGDIGWNDGDVQTLAEMLSRMIDQIVTEDVVTRAVEALKECVDNFLRAALSIPTGPERLAEALGIQELQQGQTSIQVGQMTDRQKRSVIQIAGLTVANAMIFQEILAAHDSRVQPIGSFTTSSDMAVSFANHWQFIIDDINYHPIFHVAVRVLKSLPANGSIDDALRDGCASARIIVSQKAALRHDLMGRIYHRLLVEAKYLGTFYTSIPAATLLLKLALKPCKWQKDWSDLDELKSLKIGDFACGTGTLLMAAAEVVRDNYVTACVRNAKTLQLDRFHKILIEDVINGFDVIPSALHLTASTLAIKSPRVTFQKMNLYCLPLGNPLPGNVSALGSLEFITGEIRMSRDLFGALEIPVEISSQSTVSRDIVPMPVLDLCVMNPPFTRSTGGNLLFGSSPEPQRNRMQRRLQEILRSHSNHASITAGLGSPFTLLGNMSLRSNGRLALVLPRAILCGVAWDKTRNLLKQKYALEWIVVSHDPKQWNFSENTSLSEVLIIAKKRSVGDTITEPTKYVNLWKNIGTSTESLIIARKLETGQIADFENGQGSTEINIGNEKIGEATSIPWADLRDRHWGIPCAFAQVELAKIAWNIIKNSTLNISGATPKHIDMKKLGTLGRFSHDRRDIMDGFDVSSSITNYSAFWGHDTNAINRISQRPNQYISPLSSARAGRRLHNVFPLWDGASRLLIGERIRLNTQKMIAVMMSEPVLSNVWRGIKLFEGGEEEEKVLALWLNSTLGLLTLLSLRQETEGAWVEFKKGHLEEIPVIDITSLDSTKIESLSEFYENIAEAPLQRFRDITIDNTRTMIDEAICNILDLPSLEPIRRALAREPVLTLCRL